MTKAQETARKQMVLAMETIARSINNEDFIESWLMCGVADGDIRRFDVDEVDDSYIDNDTLAELMGCFLRCMKRAAGDGGLYCDGVCSE